MSSLKQQLSKLEYRYGARKPSISVASSPVIPLFANQWRQNAESTLLKYPSAPFLKLE
jgi:hypothetical protein